MKGKKIFKIEGVSVASRYIRVYLNSGICYSGGDYKKAKDYSSVIYLAKCPPFDTWEAGDYLEIDLDRIHSSAREGQTIYDTNIVRILDSKVIEEINKSQIDLYELKSVKDKLIPMLNNFSQKIINEDFFNSNPVWGIIDGADKFAFDEFALPAWKVRLDSMTNKFEELKRECNEWKNKYNNLVNRFSDLDTKHQILEEEHAEIKEKLNSEKLKHANDIGNERLKHKDKDLASDKKITRLEEKLEASNAQNIDFKKRLESSEKRVLLLENELNDKNNQLTNLRLESGKKDSELEKKDKETEYLKNLAKSHDERAEKSQGELLTEKLRSEKENLELFAAELGIDPEQIHSLSKYYVRLFQAQKKCNQANIETHESNIARAKKELSEKNEISIVSIQEICRKCQRVAELSFDSGQAEQRQKQIQMNDWKNINPNFTPELVQEWKNYGFTYEQCADWINISPSDKQNRAIKEPAYYAWLRDIKKVNAEWVLNNGDEQELGQEFFKWYQEQQKTQIEQPVK